jgi:hypothetical protein
MVCGCVELETKREMGLMMNEMSPADGTGAALNEVGENFCRRVQGGSNFD